MPRIPRRRKQSWEEPPAAEQADAAAAPQADAADQPPTQTSTDEPLAAAGDGTVQTDPIAAAAHERSADGTDGAASGTGTEVTLTKAPQDDQPTEAMAPVTPGPVQPIDASAPPTVVQQPAVEGATGAAVAGEVAPPAAGAAPTPEAEAEAEAALQEQAPEDARPGFRERTRMRRRLRYLRRLRELAFRDLGGLVFDLHRFGRVRNDLVDGKLQALAGIDHELRTLETALRERHDFTDVREAGIAACPRCGTLHDTDANFCPGCGTSLRSAIVRDASPVTVIATEEAAAPATGGTPTAATVDPSDAPKP